MQHVPKAVPKSGIHPNVDDRVVTGVGHCQEVTNKPRVLCVSILEDQRILFGQNDQSVERCPAEKECQHADKHHLDHLPVDSGSGGNKRY